MAYNFKELKVLVVDDDVTISMVIDNIFRTLNVKECISVRCGEDALEKYKVLEPDLILTDWNMKDMDGLQLTSAIRELNKVSKNPTPIILMSGYTDIENVKQAVDLGVNEFLLKPFSVNDLATRIAYVIENPRDVIDVADYFGPDRRRLNWPEYTGPDRRKKKHKG